VPAATSAEGTLVDLDDGRRRGGQFRHRAHREIAQRQLERIREIEREQRRDRDGGGQSDQQRAGDG